jgi:hypothetical protein
MTVYGSAPANIAANSITGPTSICPPASGLIYTVTSVARADSYVWTLPTGFTITAGAGTNTITVSVSSGATIANNQNVTVYATNPCGSGNSRTLNVNVNSFAGINAGPDQSVCSGGTITLAGVWSGNTSSSTWTAPSGTFSNPTQVNSTYTPSISSGTVTLTLTTNDPSGVCLAATDQVLITVNQQPVITSQPAATQTVCSGANVSFSVTATGTGLTYQWRKGTTNLSNVGNISGATTSTLTLTGVLTSDAGNYNVIVSGASPCAAVTSSDAALVVNQVVAISAQPAVTQTACTGNSVSFSVTATGTGLTYQWRKGVLNLTDGGSISGASTNTLTINPVTAGDAAADYNVVISGTAPCAAVTSNNAALVVNDAVVITSQPAATQTVCSGANVSFSVTATGTGLTYQWRKGTTNLSDVGNISGATTSTLTLTGVLTSDAGNYNVMVSGASPCAALTSTNATLVVNDAVVITSQPAATQTVCSGANVSFSVTATGTGLTYQWRKGTTNLSNGGNISGATTATLTLTGVLTSDAGSYNVVITGTGPCLAVTSGNAVLMVNLAVSINTQPSNVGICASSPAQFAVVASGDGLTYQWYKGTFPGVAVANTAFISGAQTNILNFSQAFVPDDGIYYVVVSGLSPCADVRSNEVTLNVDQSILITTQPLAQTVCENTPNVSFSVVANAGGDPLTYQWRKNGISIPGATASTFTIATALLADAGNYDVVVSGPSGYTCPTVTSFSVALTVTPTVTIAAFSPASSTRCQGAGTVTTTTTATNTTGITYSLDATTLAFAGNSINASTGAVTYAAGWSGTTTITASAAGCNGPATTNHVVTTTPTVTIAAFSPATSTRCQGAETVTTTTTATNTTGLTYSLDATTLAFAGNNINSLTGAVTYAAGWSGTTTITASAAGCNGPATTTHVVTTTPTVTIAVFSPATSTRCQGAGTVTTTTTASNNVTAIVYSLDATTLAFAGNSINSSTGEVTYAAGWSGTTTITASAAGCNGPATTTHVVTITPTVTIAAFSPAISTRCQGAGTVTTTTTASNNAAAIVYSLDATTLAFAGNSINSSTGEVTYAAGWSGTTIITASAAGCNGPVTTTHVVTITPTVTIAAFSPATSTRCQGAGTVTTTTTATNTTGITYSLDATTLAFAGNSINASTGAVTYAAGWSGTTTITASAAGCNGPATTTHVVTTTPTVTIAAYSPATSIRCQGAGTITTTTTATNTTGITYSLDATTLAFAGNSINAITGAVTYAAGWSGTTTITASAAGCNGPVTTTHVVTITPTVTIAAFSPATSTRCQGPGSVTRTTTASNNSAAIVYSLDATTLAFAGNSINSSTGDVTYAAGWSGTTTITASAAGCNGPATTSHVVTTTPTVTIASFSPATSTRCQGAGTVTTTTTASNNAAAIVYSLDATTLAFAGNSINASTGAVTYAAGWSGTTTITASAAGCNGPVTSTHVVTTNPTSVGGTLAITGAVAPVNVSTGCLNSSGTITLSGHTGAVTGWQTSIDAGATWSALINNTTTTFNYTGVNQTTLYRAVVTSGVCGVAYSGNAIVSVIQPITPSPVTATPAAICLGQSTVITGATGFNQPGSAVDGTFGVANPPGWQVNINGVPSNFPASANNGTTNEWSESNGPKTFFSSTASQIIYDNVQPGIGGKFAVCTGIINTSLETPIFSTVGVPSAALNLWQSFTLNATSTARIEISLDGGATYLSTPLASYPSPLTYGNPLNGWLPLNVSLDNYLGQNNLRIRFSFVGTAGPTLSSWAMDGITLPGTAPAATYSWSPATGLSSTTGSPVTATPTTTTTYTLVTTVGGCTGGTASVTVTVNPLASISVSAVPMQVCASPNAQTTNIAYNSAANNPTNYSISWSATPANSFVPVVNAVLNPGNITINIPANTLPGTYNGTVSVTNSNGCSAAGSTISIQVNPRPTASLAGNTSICQGQSATLAIAVTGPGTISGQLSDGTAFSGTAPSISVTVSPAITTTYSITSLTNGTCNSIAADYAGSYTVNVSAPPVLTAQPASASYCVGTNALLTMTVTGVVSTYQWQVSTDNGASWSNISDGAQYSGTSTSNLTILNAGLSVVDNLYRANITSGSPCNTSLQSNNTKINLRHVWVGTNSIDWNTGSNWSDGAPPTLSCPNVYILGSRNFKSTLSSGTASINNLIIMGDGVVTVTNATLRMAGSITQNLPQTIVATSGTIEFNGTSGTQNIAGSYFSTNTVQNLTVSNGSGVAVSATGTDSLNITGALLFGTTNATLNTGNNVTLKSSAAATANVGPQAAGNIVTGEVTVERYLVNGRKWRLLSVPTNNATQSVRSSWLENGSLPGPVGYGFLAADTRADFAVRGFDVRGTNTSVKIFNPSIADWVPVDNTLSPIKNNQGYIVFVPGDRRVVFPASNITTLRTKGALYKGTQPTINIPAAEFAVVGNPFASRINFRQIHSSNSSNLDAVYYVWDPSISGIYGLGAINTIYKDIDGDFKNLVPSALYGGFNSVHNDIESGLAFLVKANVGSAASLYVTEADKTAGSALVSFTSGSPQGLRINLNLTSQNNQAPITLDAAMANFDEQYSNEVQNNDIKKMASFGEGVSWKTSGELIVIDRRNLPTSEDTLHIQMTKVRVQNYQWELHLDNMDYPGRSAYLIDRYLQTSTELNMAGRTTVNFSVQNIPGSYAADRFKIVFKQLGVVPVNFVSVQANRNTDRSITVQWKVANETNIQQYEVQRSADGNHFTGIVTTIPTGNNGIVEYREKDLSPLSADNYYRIKATGLGGQVQYSAIVKVGAQKQIPSISVYPNPVTNGQVQLYFTQQQAGKYQVQLSTISGQVLLEKTVDVNSAVQLQTIPLPDYRAGGTYLLKIITAEGIVYKQQVFVQ